jgi:hypothetical protein
VGWALYWVSRSDDPNAPPFFTRMIDKYTEVQDRWAKSNDLHVQMVERAGSDRVLFVNTKPQEYVSMKFPEYVLPHRHQTRNSRRRNCTLECEMRNGGLQHLDECASQNRRWGTSDALLIAARIMNQGSPYNVPAGSHNSMEKVIAKYRKEAAEDNERKLEASRSNTVQGEQPFERFSPNK